MLPVRMENATGSPPSRPLAAPDRSGVRPAASPDLHSDSPPKHKERPSKSPRRRREGKRSQRRGGGHEQLLWEMERRRLPGQQEHAEASAPSCDAAESSPRRSERQVPGRFLALRTCSHLLCRLSRPQKSPLPAWTVPGHSLRTQSLHSSQPHVCDVSLSELYADRRRVQDVDSGSAVAADKIKPE